MLWSTILISYCRTTLSFSRFIRVSHMNIHFGYQLLVCWEAVLIQVRIIKPKQKWITRFLPALKLLARSAISAVAQISGGYNMLVSLVNLIFRDIRNMLTWDHFQVMLHVSWCTAVFLCGPCSSLPADWGLASASLWLDPPEKHRSKWVHYIVGYFFLTKENKLSDG